MPNFGDVCVLDTHTHIVVFYEYGELSLQNLLFLLSILGLAYSCLDWPINPLRADCDDTVLNRSCPSCAAELATVPSLRNLPMRVFQTLRGPNLNL